MNSLIKKMKNTYVRSSSIRRGLMRGFAVAAFVAQIVIATLFFFGIADAFGKKVYLLESINLILDAFSGYWVVGVGGALLAVLYYVFLIIMIKNVIVSIKFLTNCLKDKSPDTVNRYGTYISGRLGSTFFSSIIFLVIARMVSAYTLSSAAMAVVVIGVVFYIAYWAVSSICEPYDLTIVLSRASGHALSVISVMFLFTLICKVDIPTVLNTLTFFFNSVGLFDSMSNQDIVNALFQSLISPVFLIVIQIMVLKYVERLLTEGIDFHTQDNRAKTSGVFWACMIYGMVLVVANMFVGMAANAEGFIALLKNNISWICCAVVIFIVPKAVLPLDATRKFTGTVGGVKKKANKDQKKDESAYENKNSDAQNRTSNKVSEDANKPNISDTAKTATVPVEPVASVPFSAGNKQQDKKEQIAPQQPVGNTAAKVQPELVAQNVPQGQPAPNTQGNPNMYSGNYAPQGQPVPNMQGNPNMYNGNYVPQGQPVPNMQGNPNMYNGNYVPQGQPVPNAQFHPNMQGNPNMYNRNYAPQGQPVPNMQGNPNTYNGNYVHQGQQNPNMQGNPNAGNPTMPQGNVNGEADN